MTESTITKVTLYYLYYMGKLVQESEDEALINKTNEMLVNFDTTIAVLLEELPSTTVVALLQIATRRAKESIKEQD